MSEKKVCQACGGSGLLMDDEQWQYTCSVCGGDGFIKLEDSPESARPLDVDEMNRTLE